MTRTGRGVTAGVFGLLAALLGGSVNAGDRQLVGNDFGRLRREALTLFPRGKPVVQVATELKALGFLCAPTKRVLANVSAPTVECDSAGRGFPTTPRIEVTLIARNGALADIAVGNGVDAEQADARTPDATPRTLQIAPKPEAGGHDAKE